MMNAINQTHEAFQYLHCNIFPIIKSHNSVPMVHLLVINLAHRKDRWESLQKHIQSMKELGYLSFIDTITRVDATNNPQSPTKGCMHSHLLCIQTARNMGWPSVMVVEDDVRFTTQSDQQMKELTLFTEPWKVIFGATVTLSPSHVCGVKRESSSSTLKPSVYHQVLTLKQGNVFTGTHCMLYHERSYLKMSALLMEELERDMPYPIDLLVSLKMDNVFLSVPYLALFEENDQSDVRKGKDTKEDYCQITSSQILATKLMEMLKSRYK